ncbi:MAG: hypothetical protein LC799_04640 [Actinobacteria bacterium]|nr:hypothetical protein [Actinomycetota bacterium]
MGGFIVRYTDVPGVFEHEDAFPAEDLSLERISIGARVWVRGKQYGWVAGEVSGWAGFDEYYIRITGLPRNLKMPGSNLVVRWNRPLRKPVTAVAHGMCDSPDYYEAREAFLRQLMHQRSASRGFTAALSAPIEFYQHQLDTAARVLADPVLRYLLADEVGLGKTIEAGLILRQLLLDDPTATALVVVPSTLVRQWRSELLDRLLLRDAFLDDRIRLVPHDSTKEEHGLDRHALIVIDEAHQILPQLRNQASLRGSLLAAKGLLLLSATPMRGNPNAFLELLNLVDPLAFPLDRPDEFRKRLEQRDRQATDLQVLITRRASFRQRNSVLNDLAREYADDGTVVAMVATCRAAENPEAQCWARLGPAGALSSCAACRRTARLAA